MIDYLGKLLTKSYCHNPIFVVGAPRSGTSVLLGALGEHPLIVSMRGEAPFITTIGGAAYLFEFAENKEYYLKSIRVPKQYLYDSLLRLSFEVAAGKNYGIKMILNGLLRGDISLFKKRYWCVKTFPDLNVSKSLLRLYPGVKFVYILRHGCDVVQSMTRFSGFRQQEFHKQCRAWATAMEKYRYLLNFEPAIVVRHEDLIEKPEEVFGRIFSFTGLSYHDNPTHFTRSTLVHPLDKETRTKTNVKTIFDKREPSHQNWSQEQRELFKRICGEKMREVGYDIPF